MENGNNTITPADVIDKLKDDGDFDRLRLQIIQKLKDNEDLRGSIANVVKQSSVLNRPGAENMKPRQLSDAIREDVGDTLMSQLSEGVWKIIRDEDGMKKEIRGTIESVYNRMLNPNYKEEEVCASLPSQNEGGNSTLPELVNRVGETISDNDASGPPGFSLMVKNVEESGKERTQMELPHGTTVPVDLNNEKHSESIDTINRNGQTVPLVPQGTELTQSYEDEDPDLPPGFG